MMLTALVCINKIPETGWLRQQKRKLSLSSGGARSLIRTLQGWFPWRPLSLAHRWPICVPKFPPLLRTPVRLDCGPP